MPQPKLKLDLKKLAESELAQSLSRHLNSYEVRVKRLVKDFDVKSREARDKGQKQLDKFAGQLKRTRTGLEKRVSTLYHHESQRLNQGVNELFNYLKSIAKSEKLIARAPSSPKKKSRANASDTSTAKKSSTKKRTKKSGSSDSLHSSKHSSGDSHTAA